MPDVDFSEYRIYIKLAVVIASCIALYLVFNDRKGKNLRRGFILRLLLKKGKAGASSYVLIDESGGLLTRHNAIAELRSMEGAGLLDSHEEVASLSSRRGSRPTLVWVLTAKGFVQARNLS